MLDTKPVSAKSVGDYFGVDGKLLEEQYRDHLSNFHHWDQLEHATDWILFPENIGECISIDETALSQGELYTVITNKSAKGKKGALIAMVKGTNSDKVKDILLPWELVTKIDKRAHQTEVMNLIRSARHTRIPVVENNIPVGILHAKEFISEVEVSRMNWNELIRSVTYFNADEPILSALKILQSKKSHIAIVRRKNEILGIVTLEDIFEEVVGDIYDEDDSPAVLLSSNSKIRTMNLPNK